MTQHVPCRLRHGLVVALCAGWLASCGDNPVNSDTLDAVTAKDVAGLDVPELGDAVVDAAADIALDTAACSKAEDCDAPTEPCKVAACDKGQCVVQDAADGDKCDDGDKCSDPDACKAGKCEGPSVCEKQEVR